MTHFALDTGHLSVRCALRIVIHTLSGTHVALDTGHTFLCALSRNLAIRTERRALFGASSLSRVIADRCSLSGVMPE